MIFQREFEEDSPGVSLGCQFFKWEVLLKVNHTKNIRRWPSSAVSKPLSALQIQSDKFHLLGRSYVFLKTHQSVGDRVIGTFFSTPMPLHVHRDSCLIHNHSAPAPKRIESAKMLHTFFNTATPSTPKTTGEACARAKYRGSMVKTRKEFTEQFNAQAAEAARPWGQRSESTHGHTGDWVWNTHTHTFHSRSNDDAEVVLFLSKFCLRMISLYLFSWSTMFCILKLCFPLFFYCLQLRYSLDAIRSSWGFSCNSSYHSSCQGAQILTLMTVEFGKNEALRWQTGRQIIVPTTLFVHFFEKYLARHCQLKNPIYFLPFFVRIMQPFSFWFSKTTRTGGNDKDNFHASHTGLSLSHHTHATLHATTAQGASWGARRSVEGSSGQTGRRHLSHPSQPRCLCCLPTLFWNGYANIFAPFLRAYITI